MEDASSSLGSTEPAQSSYGGTQLASSSFGSAEFVSAMREATSSIGSIRLSSSSFGSIILAQSEMGSIRLVRIPGSKRSSFLIVIGGVVVGVALAVSGGILLLGAVEGVGAATGGILSIASAMAEAFPTVTSICGKALVESGYHALLYTFEKGEKSWEDLLKQILVGAIVGAVSGGVQAINFGGIITVTARAGSGGLIFGVPEATVQALVDSALSAVAENVATTGVTYAGSWILHGSVDIEELFLDLGMGCIWSVAPIVGGGVVLRLCSSPSAVTKWMAIIGAATGAASGGDSVGGALVRAAMGAQGGYFLAKHLATVGDLFHVSKSTGIRYLPPRPGRYNHGLEIHSSSRPGRVPGSGNLPRLKTKGGEIEMVPVRHELIPSIAPPKTTKADSNFLGAAGLLRQTIEKNHGRVVAEPPLQKRNPIHPLLQEKLNAIRSATSGNAVDELRPVSDADSSGSLKDGQPMRSKL